MHELGLVVQMQGNNLAHPPHALTGVLFSELYKEPCSHWVCFFRGHAGFERETKGAKSFGKFPVLTILLERPTRAPVPAPTLNAAAPASGWTWRQKKRSPRKEKSGRREKAEGWWGSDSWNPQPVAY